MLLSHRSSDALIAVYQNNADKEIIICESNNIAEDLLGFSASELTGQSIKMILPERIHDLLDEYVEFETYGNDVGNVLNKVSSFCIVGKDKKEHTFRIKVQRSTPIDGHDQFHLILQAEQHNHRTEAFRALLHENFKGHEVLDEATGLPDRASLVKDIELVMFYVNKQELTGSFAIIELDDLDAHKKDFGEEGVAVILKHIAAITRQNLRGDDTVGVIGPGRLGLILFDAADDAAKMVLNRLRWLIAANSCSMASIARPDELASLSVCVAYRSLEPEKTDTGNMLDDLETMLDSGDVSANRVIQTKAKTI